MFIRRHYFLEESAFFVEKYIKCFLKIYHEALECSIRPHLLLDRFHGRILEIPMRGSRERLTRRCAVMLNQFEFLRRVSAIPPVPLLLFPEYVHMRGISGDKQNHVNHS